MDRRDHAAVRLRPDVRGHAGEAAGGSGQRETPDAGPGRPRPGASRTGRGTRVAAPGAHTHRVPDSDAPPGLSPGASTDPGRRRTRLGGPARRGLDDRGR